MCGVGLAKDRGIRGFCGLDDCIQTIILTNTN